MAARPLVHYVAHISDPAAARPLLLALQAMDDDEARRELRAVVHLIPGGHASGAVRLRDGRIFTHTLPGARELAL